MTTSSTADVGPAFQLLKGWLVRRLTNQATSWLETQLTAIASGEKSMQLAVAIGLAPRKIGKKDLDLSADEAGSAHAVRPGLDTTGWSLDQVARILFALASFRGDAAQFAHGIDRILATAEIGEQIALLRGLPLYPAPELFLSRAAEGVRSAVQPIFEAVAHRNPYPREQFGEAQWNQMVVKALFIDSRLAPIQGLDARRNADLARMLIDYADERRAAGRAISPELWRCVAPFAGPAEIERLAGILQSGNSLEARGAALALAEIPDPAARAALDGAPGLAEAVRGGCITWDQFKI